MSGRKGVLPPTELIYEQLKVIGEVSGTIESDH